MRAGLVALAALGLAAPASAAAPPAKQVAKLTAAERLPLERFGSSVAVDGILGVVGSPLADVAANPQAGRTHALVRNGEAWSVAVDLESKPGAVINRYLGYSAAIEGQLAAFGAINDYAGGLPAGSIYVYAAAQPDIWTIEAILPPPMPGVDRNVGVSVGISQDRIIAGRSLPDPGVPGRAFAWTRQSPGVWSMPPQTLEASDAAPADGFGLALQVAGDEALIGAPGADAARGAAYLLTWTGTEWVQSVKFVAPDRQENDRFGAAVALDGDTAMIGAPGRDSAAGVAYSFTRAGDEWTPDAAPLVNDAPEALSQFGWVIALREPYAVITALDQTIDPNMPDIGGQGRAAWFGRTPGGTWTQLAAIEAEDGIPGDRLGYAATLADGFALLGAPGEDDNLGAVYVFRLDQPVDAPCLADADCKSNTCCDGLCVLPNGCDATTTDGPTSTAGSTETAGEATSGSTGAPMLGLDPATDTGCACSSRHGPPVSFMALVLLALTRPRRRRRAPTDVHPRARWPAGGPC